MSDPISAIRNNHDLIYKGFLAIVCIAAIVFIFPKEVKFKYEFQRNKPWMHENLLAPFEFAILKSEEALQEEESLIRENSTPYFKEKAIYPDQVLKDYQSRFENDWGESELAEGSGGLLSGIFGKEKKDEELQALQAENLEVGRKVLARIYRSGIIALDDVIEGKDPDFSIVVMRKDAAEDLELQDVFTITQANALIGNRLRNAHQRAADPARIDTAFIARILNETIEPNIFYDLETSERLLQARIDEISPSLGRVRKDEGIINRGDIVTDELYQKLISLKGEYEKQLGGSSSFFIVLAGQLILVGALVAVVLFFLQLFRKDLMSENRNVVFILLMITLMVYMASVSISFPSVSIYALPFCILPVIIRIFYDVRVAIFTHTLTAVLVGFLAPNGFEFVFLQIVTGIIVVYALVSLRKRSQLLSILAIIFFTYSITYLGFAIIQEGDFQSIKLVNFGWFGSSAVLTLFAFPLVFVFEKTFGFISDVTLMELSDTNSPLLREMAQKAPGTFQHTIQVSNLAEAAALEIGGDPLLIRTGALYHDIGKMENPQFFIENQVSGVNPHDDLSPLESSRIIINHVIHGIERAKKAKLPEDIIDFIRSHHGTTKTMYFLVNYKKEHPDEEVDESKFQYPGPTPFSKETAILMMADSVEAASRSLKSHEAETISKLVDNIIDGQAAQGQFAQANITFQDISNVKKIFKKMLMNIYHVRVEYPK